METSNNSETTNNEATKMCYNNKQYTHIKNPELQLKISIKSPLFEEKKNKKSYFD